MKTSSSEKQSSTFGDIAVGIMVHIAVIYLCLLGITGGWLQAIWAFGFAYLLWRGWKKHRKGKA